MKKSILSLSIATMIGGFAVVGAANAGVLTGPAGTANVAPLFTFTTGEFFSPVTATNPDPQVANQLRQTTATGLVVNPNGIGHSLVIPYFTAQAGNSTLISVTNSDQVNGKAVKVRFRGAANSDDVLDFQLFLSPGDVWTGNVSIGSNGAAQLVTADNSCTRPTIPAAGIGFRTARLPVTFTTAQANAATLEGYVELTTMADIPPRTSTPNQGGIEGFSLATNALFTATKHDASGNVTCALPASLDTNILTQAAAVTAGFDTPTSGISGEWTIVNVSGAAVAWSGNATALQAVGGTGRANFTYFPQTTANVTAADTQIGAGNISALTADPLLQNTTGSVFGIVNGVVTTLPQALLPAVQPVFQDLPDLSTPYVLGVTNGLQNANLVSAAIASTTLQNEFLTAPGIFAGTDWTISLPTRRYNAAMDYRNSATTGGLSRTQFDAVYTSGASYFTSDNLKRGSSLFGTQDLLCLDVPGTVFYDQSERRPTNVAFSPVNSASPLCGETNVVSFNNLGSPSILGSVIGRFDVNPTIGANTAPVTVHAGWGLFDLTNNFNTGEGTFNIGIPALGNYFLKASNPAARAGLSANFSGTYPHRTTAASPVPTIR